jgi:hypothetical protein
MNILKFLFPYRYSIRKIVNQITKDVCSGNYKQLLGSIELNSLKNTYMYINPRKILPGFLCDLYVNDTAVWVPLLLRIRLEFLSKKIVTKILLDAITPPVVVPPETVSKKIKVTKVTKVAKVVGKKRGRGRPRKS